MPYVGPTLYEVAVTGKQLAPHLDQSGVFCLVAIFVSVHGGGFGCDSGGCKRVMLLVILAVELVEVVTSDNVITAR